MCVLIGILGHYLNLTQKMGFERLLHLDKILDLISTIEGAGKRNYLWNGIFFGLMGKDYAVKFHPLLDPN